MHRIDTKTAQKDKFGAGKNGFTRGNPKTGTPATDLDDDYFDMLQEELCSVVEASGASLEKGRHDQLLTALRALLLSRKNPFGDIKSDGTVKTALENLGLKEAANGVSVVGTSRNARMNIASASATATFNADELIVETALGGAQYRLANLNLSVNIATTGAGGMDTGTVPANGFVGLYVIYNPTTSTAALLAVNASSAVVPEVYGGANMPSGYTASALVGVLPTSSSQFAQCVLAGRSVSILDSTILTGNGAPGALAALTITSIPLNTNIIEMTATASLISVDTTGVFVISPSSALIGSRRVTVGASGTGGTVSTTSYVKCPVFGNTRQIYWQAQLASVSYNLVLMGYEF
ncbi:hypothetical protein AC00_2642 [Escherichia coli 1-250-04_S3_C1]|uniref:Tail fiber protein n=1 Tax=Escherichia coli 1-250-04_S3_C1 TaxID=1444135 RepID=A0AAN4NSU5_ECOLX|nr:hypothetical protein AC00_2642 [Escherichia coli 1-250-04_S3_C1]KEO32076.1 hypothetical protein AC28_2651 [Escherichia coli 1-250-04_S3_C2]